VSLDLTPYAWRFRYPGDPLDPSPEDISLALDAATKLLDSIEERLPREVTGRIEPK
jgi:hypothetical protein